MRPAGTYRNINSYRESSPRSFFSFLFSSPLNAVKKKRHVRLAWPWRPFFALHRFSVPKMGHLMCFPSGWPSASNFFQMLFSDLFFCSSPICSAENRISYVLFQSERPSASHFAALLVNSIAHTWLRVCFLKLLSLYIFLIYFFVGKHAVV